MTRHPQFNPSLHTITLLEASSIATGASGKSGGLLGLWAYPECLVPLSYRLHKELASEHGGDQKWGYRQVKCGTIGAVVKKKKDRGLAKAAKEDAEAKAPAAQPGMSSLQPVEKETGTPAPQPIPSASQTSPGNAPTPQPEILPTTESVAMVPVSVTAAPFPAEAIPHTNVATPKFTSAAFAPIPELLTPTPESPTITSTESTEENGETSTQNGTAEISAVKPESAEKDWEKLPKQDTAAASLLSKSPLPADLDWIDPEYIQSYEEMGRVGFAETAQVHPFHFTTAIAELARSAGVDIRTGAKVTKFTANGISPGSNTVEYVDRNSGDDIKFIDATDVIVTAGPWTGKLLPRSKVEGLRAHSVVYEADVSPYAVFTDIQLPGDYVPEHRARAGQKRKHRGNVDPEVYARPFGEVYACGAYFPFILYSDNKTKTNNQQASPIKISLFQTRQTKFRPTKVIVTTSPRTWAPFRPSSLQHPSRPSKPVTSLNMSASAQNEARSSVQRQFRVSGLRPGTRVGVCRTGQVRGC